MKTEHHVTTEKNVYSKKSKDGITLLKENHVFILQLNCTGEFLWKLCRQPISISSLINKLSRTYGVSKEMAHHDVSKFLKQCLHEKILKRID